jgi:hypothetical protein
LDTALLQPEAAASQVIDHLREAGIIDVYDAGNQAWDI